MFLASALVALVLKNPNQSSRLKSRFMRGDKAYERVFSVEYPLPIWPKLASIFKASESVLISAQKSKGNRGEKFLKRWRGLVALMAVAKTVGTFNFSIKHLLNLELDQDFEKSSMECWAFIEERIEAKSSISTKLTKQLVEEFADTHDLEGAKGVKNDRAGISNYPDRKRYAKPTTSEQVNQVDRLLPPQPWPTGIHRDIAAKLGLPRNVVSNAITELIAQGKWLPQTSGKVEKQ